MPSASPSSAEQVCVIDDARSRVAREATDRTGSCWRIYRDELYRADETFETAFTETARGALAVNFYHHRHQGHYSDQHLAAFEGIASTIVAAVRRDHELRVPAHAAAEEAD
ncbi:MAG: hypothetical protein ABI277_03345 [Burkholderiaceae bacterium]